MRMSLTISQIDKQNAPYAFFVLGIGEGRQPNSRFPNGTEMTPVTNSHDESTNDNFTLQYTFEFEDLVAFVYPNLSEDTRLMAPLTSTLEYNMFDFTVELLC